MALLTLIAILAAELAQFTSATPILGARDAFPGLPESAFTDNNGFQAAVEAAPVWLFARDLNRAPCYPESAVIIGSNPQKPNPGTGPPLGPTSPNPGDYCTSPGPATGLYSPGQAFPNYISSAKCGDQWRVNYSLYYVHDGSMSEGHKNDWESATVVWTDDGSGNNWQRNSLILSAHGGYQRYGWGDIQSVDEDDVKPETIGQYKAHPKVYVGFFKHANFIDKDTSVETQIASRPKKEYRSDDWYYLPKLEDMKAGSDIQGLKNCCASAAAVHYITSQPRTSSAFLSLAFHVKPNANRNREGIISVTGEHIELCVTTQPKKGEANTAVCKLLAEVLGIAKTDVETIKGHKSRYKTVSIPLYGTQMGINILKM